jgi:hypothetical protein
VPGREIFAAAAVDEKQPFRPLHSSREKVLRFGQADEPDAGVLTEVDEPLPEFAGHKPPKEREMDRGTENNTQDDDDQDTSEQGFHFRGTLPISDAGNPSIVSGEEGFVFGQAGP